MATSGSRWLHDLPQLASKSSTVHKVLVWVAVSTFVLALAGATFVGLGMQTQYVREDGLCIVALRDSRSGFLVGFTYCDEFVGLGCCFGGVDYVRASKQIRLSR